MIAEGSYRARGTRKSEAKSPDKGTPCVIVACKLLEGPDEGKSLDWVGWLTDGAIAKTAESVSTMGYGDSDEGQSPNEFVVVIEHEEFQRDNGEMAKRARIRWINNLGGTANFQTMTSAETAGARERLKAAMMAAKQKSKETGKPEDEPKF